MWVTKGSRVTKQGGVSRQFRVTRVSDLLVRKDHVPTPTFSGMTEVRDSAMTMRYRLWDQQGRVVIPGT